jgi:hypothetical protein
MKGGLHDRLWVIRKCQNKMGFIVCSSSHDTPEEDIHSTHNLASLTAQKILFFKPPLL